MMISTPPGLWVKLADKLPKKIETPFLVLVARTRSTIYEYQNKPGSCSFLALEGLLTAQFTLLNPQQLLDWSVAVLFQLLIENQGLDNRGGDGGG